MGEGLIRIDVDFGRGEVAERVGNSPASTFSTTFSRHVAGLRVATRARIPGQRRSDGDGQARTRRSQRVCVSTREGNQFPSVLLHRSG